MSDISLSNKFRENTIQQLKALPEDDIAIFLSGGVDSQTLLFALLEAGKNITAYSFSRDDYLSKDYISAKDVAKIFDIKFISVMLPTDEHSIKRDLLILHNEYLCKTKIEYECFWPFMYVYPIIKEKIVIGGFEGNWGCARDYALHYKPNIQLYRKDDWMRANRSQRIQHYIAGDKFNIFPYFPYRAEEMFRLFYSSTYEDCNKPKEKQVLIDAYPEYFSKIKINYPMGLQLGKNGISELFEERLLNSNWNIHNYKSVVGIYNSVNRGELKVGQRKLI